jgi:hypothetical protein
MNTNKAAYWIALGALALGLNSEYRQGKFEALHRVSDRAGSVLCRLSMRAERTLLAARVLTGRPELDEGQLVADSVAESAAAEMAQAEIVRESVRESVREQVRAQAEMIRAQVEMQRAQVREIRSAARSQVRMARTVSQRVVTCPKTGVRVVMRSSVSSDNDRDKYRGSDDDSTE